MLPPKQRPHVEEVTQAADQDGVRFTVHPVRHRQRITRWTDVIVYEPLPTDGALLGLMHDYPGKYRDDWVWGRGWLLRCGDPPPEED